MKCGFLWIYLLSLDICFGDLGVPSFISGWQSITAEDDRNSEVKFTLPKHMQSSEFPVKVIAEIKITDQKKSYIFNAFGSGPRDDVRLIKYGGVVCLYSKTEVRVYAPNNRQNLQEGFGYVLYLGVDQWIGGPPFSERLYRTGNVRVKVWSEVDMKPSIDTDFRYEISTGNPFLEISLFNGVEPDMVVVQATPVPAIIPHPTTSTNFYDEVISEGFGLPGCFDECGSDGGGLVFAYNSSTVRLWANSYGKIISIVGWGWPFSDFNSTLVRVRILAWYFEPDSQKCLQNSTSKTNLYSNTNIHTPSFEILGSDFFLVLAKVRIQDGENKGFTFYGSGSVVLSGRHGGGIVFGYNERGEVFTWRRLNSTGDSMLKMESPWGDGQRNQIFKHVEVELTVFPLNRTTCGNPLCEEGNSTLVFQNFTTAVYECRPGYVNQSGDLVKYCDGTPEWRGAKNQPVNCIKIKSCTEPPEEEGHATLLHYADHVNGTAVYACVGSFSLREGNLTKTCTDDLEWQGIPILCTEDDQQLSVSELTTESSESELTTTESSASEFSIEETSGSGFSIEETSGLTTTESSASELSITESSGSGVTTTESSASELSITESSGLTTTESSASELSTTESSASGLSTTESSASGLTTTESSASGLTTTESSASGLSTTESSASGLTTTESSASELSTIESSASGLITTESSGSGLTTTESSASELTTTKSTAASKTDESWTSQCVVEGAQINYSCNAAPKQKINIFKSLICKCNLGYHLEAGDLTRTCKEEKILSGKEPVCVASGSCMCPCNKVTNPKYTTPTDEALIAEIKKMRQELIVLKNTTSKALRKKISAPDFRPSVTVSGTPWVALLVAMGLWIVVPDMWTVMQQFRFSVFDRFH